MEEEPGRDSERKEETKIAKHTPLPTAAATLKRREEYQIEVCTVEPNDSRHCK